MGKKLIGLLLCGTGICLFMSTATAQQRATKTKDKPVNFKLTATVPPTDTELDETDAGASINLDYTVGGKVGALGGTDFEQNVEASDAGKGKPRPAPSGTKLKFSPKPKKLNLGKAAQYATQYAFPYSGSDLTNRAYIVTTQHQDGIQVNGFDISMRKWRTSGYLKNTWSPINKGVTAIQRAATPKDEQSLVYRKPIYAMADGQVVACWRNTEENPRPFSSSQGDSWTSDGKEMKEDRSNMRTCEQSPWLHPKLCSNEMPGGGNMLWVKQANDVFALYAHMVPGTISESLCPNNGVFFPAPSTELKLPNFAPEIAVTNGAMIKKGQFLGRTGNSGSSTGPHLHVHMEKDNKTVPIKFEGGLYVNLPKSFYVDKNNADENFTSFGGSTLPVKTGMTTFVWPNRKNKFKFNRKNVEARHYKATFKHLTESGMWPGLVTCKYFPVKNTYLYDFINWEKAPKGAKWYGRHGLTEAKLVAEISKAKAKGYKLTSSYTCNKSAQNQNSVAIFKK